MYTTKRNTESSMVNAFNSLILRHSRSNMNVSYVYNAESLAFYVCYYVLKAEPDELRTALGDLIYNIFKQNPAMSQQHRLFKIGLCVLKHRRLFPQEAAYHLSNMPLVQSSREKVSEYSYATEMIQNAKTLR